jgi:hypothetical protein
MPVFNHQIALSKLLQTTFSPYGIGIDADYFFRSGCLGNQSVSELICKTTENTLFLLKKCI